MKKREGGEELSKRMKEGKQELGTTHFQRKCIECFGTEYFDAGCVGEKHGERNELGNVLTACLHVCSH